jgi:hypothetical protein
MMGHRLTIERPMMSTSADEKLSLWLCPASAKHNFDAHLIGVCRRELLAAL